MDRWVLSRLNATVREVTAALDAFDALRGRRPSSPSSRRVELVRAPPRPRFWRSADDRPRHAPPVPPTIARLLGPTALLADALHRP